MLHNSSTISYSKALIELSKDNLDDVFNNILKIKNTLNDNPLIMETICIPVLSFEKKMSILKDIFVSEFKMSSIEKLIELVVRKRKAGNIMNILEGFEELYYQEKKIVKVEILSASKLSDSDIGKIISKIGLDIKKTIITEIIDKSLIGGFVIKYNQGIYDCSVKKKLIDIKNSIN